MDIISALPAAEDVAASYHSTWRRPNDGSNDGEYTYTRGNSEEADKNVLTRDAFLSIGASEPPSPLTDDYRLIDFDPQP